MACLPTRLTRQTVKIQANGQNQWFANFTDYATLRQSLRMSKPQKMQNELSLKPENRYQNYVFIDYPLTSKSELAAGDRCGCVITFTVMFMGTYSGRKITI